MSQIMGRLRKAAESAWLASPLSYSDADMREPGDREAGIEAIVRAVLEELRSPSDAMRAAALNAGLPGPRDPPLYEMIWRDMINAALADRV